jgi:CRISPR-associated protein Cmr1
MKPITFNFTTVTPMFSSGADQSVFELRPSSFKGLLRFWWRAAYWGQRPKDLSIKDIQQAEGRIFGTAASDGRKSAFSIRISPTEFEGTRKRLPKYNVTGSRRGQKFPVNILEYLAHGMYDMRSKIPHQDYLPVEREFTLTLKPSSKEVGQSVITSVYFLAVFGGIGAKSRNGFGNLMVKNSKIFSSDEYELDFSKKSS